MGETSGHFPGFSWSPPQLGDEKALSLADPMSHEGSRNKNATKARREILLGDSMA